MNEHYKLKRIECLSKMNDDQITDQESNLAKNIKKFLGHLILKKNMVLKIKLITS